MKKFWLGFVPALLLAGDPLSPGQKLDSVQVYDPAGVAKSFSLQGKTSIVVFVSTVCPITNDYNDRLSALYRDYTAKGVQLVFVNANSNESAADVAEHTKAAGFPFVVYRDRNNALADVLGATVTPETYVFDRDGVLRYHGNV